MKETILKRAGETFLKYGFKSVTMDDIANDLGISKKTIYKHFKNKVELVDQATEYMHNLMHTEVLKVYNMEYNAIEENFEANKVFKGFMQNSDDSPIYQLKKYYPETYNKIMSREFCMFRDCLLTNVEKGIREGLFRANLYVEQVVKFYFSLIMSVHDSDIYTYSKNTINKLELNVLEYHIRAIATKKGIKELEKQLAKLNTI
ncbi:MULTISPECIES: TetR/AcrR family transcriptional regulator [Flavobacteriaceae]|uniref:TetR/AcrR family transcriptional regulator n=2 Tax=Flavobacteriaceae TaxID=49546 RepID=A0A4Y8ASN4_9FLAO|nr:MULTISPECIES: TetR/AcrR family transcriptional regulator [Flavobacteriaceae]TEW74894.1 TetR/AcrR family transcriptional regulator [Gramella jeungdoensis]GGK43221.1 TetR family transcriptional regulator [Lutibacter litoralis]